MANFVFLIVLSLLVFGCATSPPQQASFSNSVTLLESVEQKYIAAKTASELQPFQGELESFKTEQTALLEGSNELPALNAFLEYKSKEFEAKKSAFLFSESVSSNNLSSASLEQIEEVENSITEVTEKITQAQTALTSFETSFPTHTNSKVTSGKQLLANYKLTLGELSLSLLSQKEEIPSFAMPQGITGPIDFEKAKQIVISEVVKDQTTVVVFSDKMLLSAGTKVFEKGPVEKNNLIWETNSPAWFFWIDDSPTARFSHPVRFVFVKQNGEFIVFNGSFWPVINEVQLFYPDIIAESTENIVFGSIDFSAPQITSSFDKIFFQSTVSRQPTRTRCPCTQDSKVYAIVVQGDSRKDFEADTESVMDSLEGGSPQADGWGNADSLWYLAPPSNESDNVDSDVSAENFKQALDEIKKTIRCCDVLIIYFSTHGSKYGKVKWYNKLTGAESTSTEWDEDIPSVGDTSFGLWVATSVDTGTFLSTGEESGISSDRVDELLDEVNCANTFVFIDSCHSGAAIDDLKGDGRTITTASTGEEVAYGGDNLTSSAVTTAFVSGLNGDLAADADGDGMVTTDEAMQHPTNVPADSTPQFWTSTNPVDCPDVCPLITTGIGIDGSGADPNSGGLIIEDSPDFDIKILVDWQESGVIDLGEEKINHIIIESDKDIELPMELKVSVDDTDFISKIIIANQQIQCAHPKKCSSDIDTREMPPGNAVISVTDASGNEYNRSVQAKYN